MYPPQYVYVVNVPNDMTRVFSYRDDAELFAAMHDISIDEIIKARYVL